MKNGIICLNKFENNSLIKEREIALKLYGTNRPLIRRNEYLIIGDVGQIIFINNINNFKREQQSFNGENRQDKKRSYYFYVKNS